MFSALKIFKENLNIMKTNCQSCQGHEKRGKPEILSRTRGDSGGGDDPIGVLPGAGTRSRRTSPLSQPAESETAGRAQ